MEATTQLVDQAYAGTDSGGSRKRPWKTVGEGVNAAQSGAIVAVAEGCSLDDLHIGQHGLHERRGSKDKVCDIKPS